MGIMDIFKTTEPAAPAAPAAKPDTTSPPKTEDGKMAGTNQEPVNPLDAYAKLFDNATKADDAPPSFTLDPKVLNDVSGSLDFTKAVSPELLSAAQSGDNKALLQIINQVGQQSYKAALHHSTSLTDRFVSARSQHDLKGIGSQVKRNLTEQALSSTPNYNHPVVKAQLNSIANAMQVQNPDATPEQIANAAQQYIKDLADALNPAANKKDGEGAADEMDWSKYLTS